MICKRKIRSERDKSPLAPDLRRSIVIPRLYIFCNRWNKFLDFPSCGIYTKLIAPSVSPRNVRKEIKIAFSFGIDPPDVPLHLFIAQVFSCLGSLLTSSYSGFHIGMHEQSERLKVLKNNACCASNDHAISLLRKFADELMLFNIY